MSNAVSRYYDACYRLDEARLQGKRRRVELLNYGVQLLVEDAREAMAYERARIRTSFDNLFADFRTIFGKDTDQTARA